MAAAPEGLLNALDGVGKADGGFAKILLSSKRHVSTPMI